MRTTLTIVDFHRPVPAALFHGARQRLEDFLPADLPTFDLAGHHAHMLQDTRRPFAIGPRRRPRARFFAVAPPLAVLNLPLISALRGAVIGHAAARRRTPALLLPATERAMQFLAPPARVAGMGQEEDSAKLAANQA